MCHFNCLHGNPDCLLRDNQPNSRKSQHSEMNEQTRFGVGIMEIAASCPRFIESDVWRKAIYFCTSRKAIQHLEGHLDEPNDLNTIASVAGMERTAFSKSFKRKTGITFHKFVQAYRVSMAVDKMQQSDESITSIAFELGFNSVATFERAFKKVTGQTPSGYRAQLIQRMGLAAHLCNSSANR
jgi:AraC-like DNA-binding protein